MSTVCVKPLLHHYSRSCNSRFGLRSRALRPSSPSLSHGGRSFCRFEASRARAVRASSTGTAMAETVQSEEVLFEETFPLKRTVKEEGKISVRLDQGEDGRNWQLTVGCSLPGKWLLHWGVSYIDDVGSEWDQPPEEMRPPGSIPIKGYAIETPLTELSSSSSEECTFQEVKIDCQLDSGISAINFVLKDEETGAWYQRRGRDFKVPLVDNLQDESSGQLSSMLVNPEALQSNTEDIISKSTDLGSENSPLEGFYEEHPIAREVSMNCSVCVSLKKCPETAKSLLYVETDMPGEVVVHWGVCRDEAKNWEIPAAPYPPETKQFKNKALRTPLQKGGGTFVTSAVDSSLGCASPNKSASSFTGLNSADTPKEGGVGSAALFTLDEEFAGFLFVLKLDENRWLKCMGKDFCIPLSSSSSLLDQQGQSHFGAVQVSGETAEEKKEDSPGAYTTEIIDEIRSLVSGISSEKSKITKTKEEQEIILQEIEKLAAEAYSIFRTARPTFSEEEILEIETPVIRSGTGSGSEIVCQGFNWESHKSGRWYMELKDKAAELASFGITVIWLPPPTDSVSPEGYMPRDLYNLNSRYGNMDELKDLVRKLHEVGITALGDVVLNHRCAQYQNKNGIWNIFGGQLNWDDRAIVADDPHFQGRGNKSSGDCFHAAPNIDHSQDFVRTDIKEWLLWLKKDIGYDGWRIDFVRGFWGGYVKEYLDASEPFFAVGEYWDSLSYTYGEMDHDQDYHRQRIVDWISATGGTAGAFDVTTKGILHAALEKCEYWRLSDKNGKPPGVVGWWPSRAVTFIENHDTGSTQGHWRFPSGKEMQGYAYILTHPGTPSIFYDHIFSHFNPEIAKLVSIRNKNKVNCRSMVNITKAERDVYAAMIDEKVAVKIGPGHYEPPGGQNWSVATEGRDYKVWETS